MSYSFFRAREDKKYINKSNIKTMIEEYDRITVKISKFRYNDTDRFYVLIYVIIYHIYKLLQF